jgi:hypothetical protein
MDISNIIKTIQENPALSNIEVWKKIGKPMSFKTFESILLQIAMTGPVER